MRALAWIMATLFIAYGALTGWGAVISLRRLDRVPPGKQRTARFMVVSAIAGTVVRFLIAVTLVLAAYVPADQWRVPVVIALAIALAVAMPGLGMFMWHHHEPWIQEWRGAG